MFLQYHILCYKTTEFFHADECAVRTSEYNKQVLAGFHSKRTEPFRPDSSRR